MKKLNVKRVSIVAGCVIVLFLVIYLGICIIACGNDFLSNTTINGINVSSMTKKEAISALEKQFASDTKNNKLTLKVDKKTYTVDVTDNLNFDCEKTVNSISDKETGFFLSKGFQYMFNSHQTVPVTIKDKEVLKQQIEASTVLEYNTGTKTSYELKENEVVFTKGTSGKTINAKSVNNDIVNALKKYDFNKITCTILDSNLSNDEMDSLCKELSNGAKDATLDKNNNYAITDSQNGAHFDLDKAKSLYNDTDEGKKFSIKAEVTLPKVSKADLEANLFRDVLGEYSTNVSGSSTRKNNVRLAGEKCNGIILLPGEEFSYNGSVGKRTKANGFGEAGAYLNGETVQEVGGGVCQTSSTLYNAVLLSNLKITERTNHTYISSYVPIGLDATVSWGGPDFKFKNDQDYPIKIEMSYSNSKIYAKIYGTNVTGNYVVMKSERTATIAYSSTTENDPTLLEGQTKVKQGGSNGAKANSYRLVYDKNGNLLSNKLEASSNYKPHNAITLVGTMKAPVTPTTPESTTPTTPDTTTTEQTTN